MGELTTSARVLCLALGNHTELTFPSEKSEDGKSYVNPPSEAPSTAYEAFVEPIDNGRRGGFDVHIYYYQVARAKISNTLALTGR